MFKGREEERSQGLLAVNIVVHMVAELIWWRCQVMDWGRLGWDRGRGQKAKLEPIFAAESEGRMVGNNGTLGVPWGDWVLSGLALDREKEQPLPTFQGSILTPAHLQRSKSQLDLTNLKEQCGVVKGTHSGVIWSTPGLNLVLASLLWGWPLPSYRLPVTSVWKDGDNQGSHLLGYYRD